MHRQLSDVANKYLVGLYQSRSDLKAGALPSLVVPQALADLGCIGVWCYDDSSETWNLSDSLVKVLGADPEHEALDFRFFVEREDADAFREILIAAVRLPGRREVDHRLVSSVSQVTSVRSYLYSLGSATGLSLVVGAVFDLHSMPDDQSGQASGLRSKLALRASQHGLFDWDIPSDRITYNGRAAELLGLSSNSPGHNFASLRGLIHPADRANMVDRLEDHLAGRIPALEAEMRVRYADGNYHWVLIRGKVLRDAERRPTRLVGLSTDINARKHAELALRESEEWLRGAVEGSFDAIQILKCKRDEAGSIIDFEVLELNGRAEEYAGLKRSDMIGKLLSEIIPNCRETGDFEKFTQVVETRNAFEEERVEPRKDMGLRWFHVQAVPVGDGISLTVADITDRKEAEQVLIENKQFIEKLARSLPEFIYVVDIDETAISYQNRDFLSDLGYPSDMITRGLLSFCDLVHVEDLEACELHRQTVRESTEDEVFELTCRMRTARDDWRWFRIRSVVFRRNSKKEPIEIIRTIHDVTPQMQSELELHEKVRQLRLAQTELRERQEQLENLNQRLAALATTDGLTGLYNYRAFHEKLAEETRRARRYAYPLAVILADVDDFKAYNDRFGHPAGDERLRQFARMLKEESRDSDFVARYGGEEFAMILINTTSADASRYAQRLVDRLNKDKGYKQLTASFGCVELEPQDSSMEDLVRRADACLYNAKRQGKNRVVVSSNGDKTVANKI